MINLVSKLYAFSWSQIDGKCLMVANTRTIISIWFYSYMQNVSDFYSFSNKFGLILDWHTLIKLIFCFYKISIFKANNNSNQNFAEIISSTDLAIYVRAIPEI